MADVNKKLRKKSKIPSDLNAQSNLNSDTHKTNKSMHVTVPLDIYEIMKKKLYDDGFNMQQVFREFSLMLATNDSSGNQVFELIKKRIIDKKAKNLQGNAQVADINDDMLYHIIEETDEHNEERDEERETADEEFDYYESDVTVY